MADVYSKEKRSEVMGQVRAKNTKPELLIRKYLYKYHFRFRLHDKNLPGSPDIKLTKYKAVIFINGCFWHNHQVCGRFKMPKTNTDYWQKKIDRNISRDHENYGHLASLGWRVFIVWECELKKMLLKRRSALLSQN